jgi:hypothetical protein
MFYLDCARLVVLQMVLSCIHGVYHQKKSTSLSLCPISQSIILLLLLLSLSLAETRCRSKRKPTRAAEAARARCADAKARFAPDHIVVWGGRACERGLWTERAYLSLATRVMHTAGCMGTDIHDGYIQEAIYDDAQCKAEEPQLTSYRKINLTLLFSPLFSRVACRCPSVHLARANETLKTRRINPLFPLV